VEQDPIVDGTTTGDYVADFENKTITFSSGITLNEEVIVNYAYDISLVVTAQAEVFDEDGNLIVKEGKIVNKSIQTMQELRSFGQKFLQENSEPSKSTSIPYKGFLTGIEAGKTIRVLDSIEGIDEELIIDQAIYNYSSGVMDISVGSYRASIYDWQKEVNLRLKELNQENNTADTLQIYQNLRGTLSVENTGTATISTTNPVDSFILGHTTLGRLRTDLNFEADCSDNGNHGTWSGTSIGGSQYEAPTEDGSYVVTTPVQRLSCGVFNGTDNEVTVGSFTDKFKAFSISYFRASADAFVSNEGLILHDAAGSVWYKQGTNDWHLYIAVGALRYRFRNITPLADDLLHQVTISMNQSTKVLTRWRDGVLVDTYNSDYNDGSLTGTTFHVGKGVGVFWTGKIDEVMLFDTEIDIDDAVSLYANKFYNNHSLFANCLLWWSFDNPRLGNRRTTKHYEETL